MLQKGTVESCRSIDVLEWNRSVYLEHPRQFSWAWSRDGEAIASINVGSSKDHVILKYRSRSQARIGPRVEACTNACIALVITAGWRAQACGNAISTLLLALTGTLMIKDRLTRESPAGFPRRAQHMGIGLVGRTLGSIGIGNIGAELRWPSF